MKKSFRGVIADGGQEQIRLSTNNGLTGYKINKFEIMPARPGSSGADFESVVKVYSAEQATVDGNVNFTDPLLLAAAAMGGSASLTIYNSTLVSIFDNMVFNQDIFLTHTEKNGSEDINYYLELEQVTLSKDEATVATLKDMRAGPDTNFGP